MGILLLLGLLCTGPLHGDLDLRIASASLAIAQHPDSTILYLERGELYVLHEDYALAIRDFRVYQRDNLNAQRLWAGLGKAYFGLAEPDSALVYFDRALRQDPDMFSVKEAKARLLALMQQPCAGAALYKEILLDAAHPGPSVFIDASQLWMQCNVPDGKMESIRVLEEGVERLGPLHVLHKELVRRYVEINDLPSAIAWQTKLIESSGSPLPLLDRAALYLQAKQPAAAKTDISAALEKLHALPDHRKSTPGFQQLLARGQALMKQIDP